MNENRREYDDVAPAYYARPVFVRNTRAREWWTLAHPPYTLCHLSFVVVGACLEKPVSASRLLDTLVAFFLAVGVSAHALDELHGRPLRTTIPTWQLVAAAVIGLVGSCALGVYGMTHVSWSLAYFILVGVVLAIGYNLEIAHGLLHNDVVFALGWGAFPLLTGFFAQHVSLNPEALLASLYAAFIALAQRRLSTPARMLKRTTNEVEGSITMHDGRRTILTRAQLLAPLERALSYLCWASVLLASALALARFRG